MITVVSQKLCVLFVRFEFKDQQNYFKKTLNKLKNYSVTIVSHSKLFEFDSQRSLVRASRLNGSSESLRFIFIREFEVREKENLRKTNSPAPPFNYLNRVNGF